MKTCLHIHAVTRTRARAICLFLGLFLISCGGSSINLDELKQKPESTTTVKKLVSKVEKMTMDEFQDQYGQTVHDFTGKIQSILERNYSFSADMVTDSDVQFNVTFHFKDAAHLEELRKLSTGSKIEFVGKIDSWSFDRNGKLEKIRVRSNYGDKTII